MRKINYVSKVCPSNENYWKSEWRIVYDLLKDNKSVEFSNNIVRIVRVNWSGEEVLHSIYFSSDRAYKRCEKLYNDGYYKVSPYMKEDYNY